MSLLQGAQSVFLQGIKGVAMTGLAVIMHQMGKSVTGSDTQESQITDTTISQNHFSVVDLDEPLPLHIDLVVYSGSHGGVNSIQVREAKAKGIPVVPQATIIAELITYFSTSIAVCGCHGKTGTSALLAYTLHMLGVNVSWLVGAPYFTGSTETVGHVHTFPGAHYAKHSGIFVFEADEYGVAPPQDPTPKILLYHPTHILCTNVDFDHPDIYRDINHVRQTFQSFFTHATAVYECNSKSIEENIGGVSALLVDMGFTIEAIQKAMKGFVGVARRLESHGSVNGIQYVDDYGHHPAEIVVAIDQVRKRYPARRVVVGFQSHTYSRTQALKHEFVNALCHADIVLIDQIFPSARERQDTQSISAFDLEDLAVKQGFHAMKAFRQRTELIAYARTILKHGDVFLTIGAGDIYKIIPDITH